MKQIKLPKPQIDPEARLITALTQRRAVRNFKAQKIALPVLSNMLWAAWGINRPEDGRRTAPTAFNWQDTIIYGLTTDTVWHYDAAPHALLKVRDGDFRRSAGTQDFVFTAPLNLIYVSDFSRMHHSRDKIDDEYRTKMAFCHAGIISQNVSLFCFANGLGAVTRASTRQKYLAEPLMLTEQQKVIIGQTIGYPV